jgi:hypothetical protein
MSPYPHLLAPLDVRDKRIRTEEGNQHDTPLG